MFTSNPQDDLFASGDREVVGPKPVGELQSAIDVFDRLYHMRYAHHPTWGPKQGAMLKRLIKSHGVDEVERRIVIYFEQTPAWMKGALDLGRFVSLFDKLVEIEKSTGLTPEQIRSWGRGEK